MQPIEKWKPVAGHEGRYEVSNLGHVRSLDSIDPLGRLRHGRTLRPTAIPSGYLTVVLYGSGRKKTHTVHRMVAVAFHGCSDYPVVRHLDGIRTNNVPSNLAWGTFAENSQDSVAHGTNANARKTACLRGHDFTTQNTGLRKSGRRYCKRCETDRVAATYRRNKELK